MSYINDVATSEFKQRVVERSHDVPVVVDFWAEWCAPCRTLGPMLERATTEANGDFELAKVDVDQNQALASQFEVQGIPTVVGFRDGQAVSRFTGAIPEDQLETWLSDLVPDQLDQAVAQARDHLLAGDETSAERVYRDVLEEDAEHVEAAIGLATLLLPTDRSNEAIELLESVPATDEVERMLAAARLRSPTGDIGELEAALDSRPDDPDLRLELASALAGAESYERALEYFINLVRQYPDYREAARLRMLDLFKVLGEENELTAQYRTKLANALF